jgi:hypothetical protein
MIYNGWEVLVLASGIMGSIALKRVDSDAAILGAFFGKHSFGRRGVGQHYYPSPFNP